jgi:drug/metabolite transporter (DMT)-like permease
MTRVPATAALLMATAVWGSTFAITKQSLDDMAPASFLSWRFGIAAVVLVAARPRSLRDLAPTDRVYATVLGLLLGVGFLLQTTGLLHTLAGVSGFLTGAAVILTPVVAAVVFGDQVGRTGWGAVAVCAVGLGLLTGGAAGTTWPGALLTLAGAACFAGHITGLSQWATARNAYGVTAWSVAVAALLCAAVAGSVRALAVPPTADAWRSVTYLALAATCAGFVVQAWAQSALTATTAAVVMTMEPVFAALLAFGLGERGLTSTGWVGGLLVVASMFLAELGPRQCCDALTPRVECC